MALTFDISLFAIPVRRHSLIFIFSHFVPTCMDRIVLDQAAESEKNRLT